MTEFFATPDDLGDIHASELHTSLGESLGAQFGESFMSGSRTLWRGLQYANAAGNTVTAPDLPSPQDLEAMQDLKASIPEVPAADAQMQIDQAGLKGQVKLPVQPSIKQPVLDLMIQHGHEQADYEAAVSRGPQGFLPGALGFATSIGAGMIDPVNIAAFSIPVLGEARWGKMLADAGDSVVGRAGVRAMQGAAQGAAGGAALAPADWWLRTRDGQDYTMADALKSVVMSAGMGAAFHAGFGGFRDFHAAAAGGPLEGSLEDLVTRGPPAKPDTSPQPDSLEARPGEDVPGVAVGREFDPTDTVEPIPDAWAEAELNQIDQEVGGAPRGSADEVAGARGRHPAEILADLPQRAREDVVRAAMADMIADRPVRVGEMLNAAADLDPRIAESVREPAASADDDAPAPQFSDGRVRSLGSKPLYEKLPLPEWVEALLGTRMQVDSGGQQYEPFRRFGDVRPEYENPDAVAESKQAAATPEPVSIVEPEKAPSAAEAAARDADKLLSDIRPRLSDEERQVFDDALNRVDHDKATSEQMVRDGAACLAEAIA